MAEKSFLAVEKNPSEAEARVGLAASYYRLRRFDLADRAYQEVVRIVGRTPKVLDNIGFSHLLRGDYARARKTFREVRAKDPTNPYIEANRQLPEESASTGKVARNAASERAIFNQPRREYPAG